MGRRLPDEVVHGIRIRIDAGEKVPAISKATKVAKSTIHKLQLNLDLWGEPYAPPTVVLWPTQDTPSVSRIGIVW